MKKGFLSEKEYNFIYSRVPRICVDLVIKNQGGVVLSKRLIEPYANSWHLPGGRVQFRESIAKAIQRIALAEIGQRVLIKKLVGCMEFLLEVQKGQPRHSVSLVWEVVPVKKKITGSWQAEKFKIFTTSNTKILAIHRKFLKEHKYLK